MAGCRRHLRETRLAEHHSHGRWSGPLHVFLALALAACGPGPEDGAPLGVLRQGLTTAEFQQGVLPTSTYQGCGDTFLAELQPATKHGPGVLINVDAVDTLTGRTHALIRWNLSSIPAGSVVVTASLTLNVTNASPGAFDLYEVSASWVEPEATWTDRSSAATWQLPGGTGAADRGSAPLQTFPAGTFSTTGTKTLPLGNATVCELQTWVDAPSTNFGWMMTTEAADGLDVSSSEATTPALRPKLSVVYGPAGTASLCVDAGAPDAGTDPDAGTPDGGPPDAGTPDAGTSDAGGPDAGAPDAGTPDAGKPDAGPIDAGRPDAGGSDAGVPDGGGGTLDAGSFDAGGGSDGGTPDAGRSDAGAGPTGDEDAGDALPWRNVRGFGCQSAPGGGTLLLLAALLLVGQLRRPRRRRTR